jgi:hypothetical protein
MCGGYPAQMGMFLLSGVVLQFDPIVREVIYSYINSAGQLLSDLGE